MNGSPEPQDAPAASSTSSAAPSPAAPGVPQQAAPTAPGVPSQAAPTAPPPAAPASTARAAAAPAGQAPVPPPPGARTTARAAAAPAGQAPVPPPPGAPTSAAPPPPPAGQAVPPGMRGGMPRLHRKSPFLAGLLSLMPGIGQIYVGYYTLGFIHMTVFATTIGLLTSVGPLAARPGSLLAIFLPALSIFLGFFVIYNIVDAVRRATLYNLAVEGAEGIELPDLNVSLPKLQGSVGGGAALIAIGLLLLSNTLFDVPLEWLASWWPLGLVALGAYLVMKARQERRAADPPAGGAE